MDTNLPETQENVKTLHLNVKQENSSARHVYTVTNSWPRAKRIISYVLMFICRTRLRKECSSLNLADLEHTATNFLLREAQKEDYRDAYNRLRELRPLHNDDKLASLSPFIDEDGLIRVGGRLRHSSLLFGFKHPILLPARHPLSIMILLYYREKTYHQGRHLTMGSLCQAGYHLHKGRHTIRKLLAECVVCQRLRGIPQTQMMADLPADRLEECPPFSNIGIDVFGPHLIHDGISTRNRPGTKKIWALLITCLNSRAVHIEPLTSLDTVTFKLALRRFIATRGNCKRIRSDQGTNFVGARNEMAELPGVDTEEIKKAMQEVGCTWELNTPGASHMGGVWERKVGAIKKILNAALLQLNNRTLSRDELYTLLQEAACIVNNTPLYECSSNPNDPAPISPAMLLTLRDNPNPPPPEAYSPADLLQYGRARWRRTQYLANQFWVRWRLNYLTELQERNKWKQRRPCISVDDIVMLKGPAARNTWPTARVIDVHPNKDGLPRSVTLRVPSSENNRVRVLKRAIHDLVLLIPKNKSN